MILPSGLQRMVIALLPIPENSETDIRRADIPKWGVGSCLDAMRLK